MRCAFLLLGLMFSCAARAGVLDEIRTDRPERLLHFTQTWERRLMMTSDAALALVYWRDCDSISELVLITSADVGSTWSQPAVLSKYSRLNSDKYNDFGPRAAAALGKNDDLYVVYADDGQSHGVFFQRHTSTGKGQWRPAAKKAIISSAESNIPRAGQFGAWPAICVDPDGVIWVFFKARISGRQTICEKHSRDGGETWSPRKAIGSLAGGKSRWADATLLEGRPVLFFASPRKEAGPDRLWLTRFAENKWDKPSLLADVLPDGTSSICMLAGGSGAVTAPNVSGGYCELKRGRWSPAQAISNVAMTRSLTSDGRQIWSVMSVPAASGKPRAAGLGSQATQVVRLLHRPMAHPVALTPERSFVEIWARTGGKLENITTDATDPSTELDILADRDDQLFLCSRRKFDIIRFVQRDESKVPASRRSLEERAVEPVWEYSAGNIWQPLEGEGFYDFSRQKPGEPERGLMCFQRPDAWTPTRVGGGKRLYAIRITRSGAKRTRPIVFTGLSPEPTAFGIETVEHLPAGAPACPAVWTELIGWGHYRVRFARTSRGTFRLAIESRTLRKCRVGVPVAVKVIAIDRAAKLDEYFSGPIDIFASGSEMTFDGPDYFQGGVWNGTVTFWKPSRSARITITSSDSRLHRVRSNTFTVRE